MTLARAKPIAAAAPRLPQSEPESPPPRTVPQRNPRLQSIGGPRSPSGPPPMSQDADVEAEADADADAEAPSRSFSAAPPPGTMHQRNPQAGVPSAALPPAPAPAPMPAWRPPQLPPVPMPTQRPQAPARIPEVPAPPAKAGLKPWMLVIGALVMAALAFAITRAFISR
jgi:hypothetical protein